MDEAAGQIISRGRRESAGPLTRKRVRARGASTRRLDAAVDIVARCRKTTAHGAIPVRTGSAAHGVSEAFGWESGLDRPQTKAPQFYAVIALATVLGAAINFLGINPIDALVITAVINGLLAPARRTAGAGGMYARTHPCLSRVM